jgi:hypothetical protein
LHQYFSQPNYIMFLPAHHPSWTNQTDPEDPERVTDKTRKLGLVVVRGTQVSLVAPQDGVEEIANPFLAADDEEDEEEAE